MVGSPNTCIAMMVAWDTIAMCEKYHGVEIHLNGDPVPENTPEDIAAIVKVCNDTNEIPNIEYIDMFGVFPPESDKLELWESDDE